MILEHEIPYESKLYFGKNAKLKREIENKISELLYNSGYEEIITPHFSYHQIITDDVIRLTDRENKLLSFRRDSTIDVVRIINKRLDTQNKKWFYIQPVFSYPSCEQNQIGVEIIDEKKVEEAIAMAIESFKKLKFNPLLQISNINIPTLLSKKLNINIEWFKHTEIQKLLSLNIDWLKQLVYIQNATDLKKVVQNVPEFLKKEIQKIIDLAESTPYSNIIVAPLYYAKMQYYDELFFRFFEGNIVYSRGGRYLNEKQTCVGFGIYTDEIIEKLSKKVN